MWLQGGLSSLLPHPGQLKGETRHGDSRMEEEVGGWGDGGGHHGSK